MDRGYVDNVRRIILEAYVRIQSADPGARRQLKTSIYEELKKDGQSEMAEVLLLYDAVMMGAMHEMADKPNVVYNFNNSQIANANFGSQIGTITASLSAVASRGKEGQEFATALKTITEGVVNSDELDEQQKKNILQALELVGQEAAAPPEKRKRGVLEPVLESLPKLLSSASALVNLWHTFGPHITGFFQ